MFSVDQLLSTPLPLEIVYAGKDKVAPKLRKLTIVEWIDLNIGFLSEAGSKGAVMSNGSHMWIMDVAMHYVPTTPGTEG